MKTSDLLKLTPTEQINLVLKSFPTAEINKYKEFLDPKTKVDFGTLSVSLDKEENIVFNFAEKIAEFHAGLMFGQGTGFDIIELDVSEARKMDGGLTCMSLRF